MKSLAAITNAEMIRSGEKPKREIPDALVAAVSTVLWQMKDAGLADFGQIKDPQSVAEKSATYAEALLSTEGDHFARRICPECVFAAADRICRTPAKKEGERTPIPTAGDFRQACLEAWGEIYRHVSVAVIENGHEVHAITTVRRDSPPEEVQAALDRTEARALAAGCKSLPARPTAPVPLAEIRARMHKMLGWEAPDA